MRVFFSCSLRQPVEYAFSGKQDALLGIAANYGQMGLLCCFCAGSIHFMTSYSVESILLPIQHYFNSAVSIKFTSDDQLTSCTGLSSPVVLRRLITISVDPGPERASLAASGTKGTIKAEVVVHVQ